MGADSAMRVSEEILNDKCNELIGKANFVLNQLVKEGMPITEASITGAKMRLRPVLMTALTTTLGLFPLLLATGTGSEIQRPLATVVVGGLVTSTVLTLLVIPAFYKWFAERPNGSTNLKKENI